MNILIVFSSVSEHSGLHDNILETVVEAKNRGHRVFVAYRSGEFLGKIKKLDIEIIETDCKLRAQAANKIKAFTLCDIDIIHTHPGDGRKVAVRLSRELDIPMVMTIHGKWTNNISNYIDHLAAVFTVSESIKQKVIDECNGSYEKVHVIPNYSNYYNEIPTNNDIFKISLITRLDKDKDLIMEMVQDILPIMNEYSNKLELDIIGDGTEKEKFIDYLTSYLNNNIEINFLGWIDDKVILKNHYQKSDLIIGPGRVVIDAYALNKPALVIGSKRYEGYITKKNWQELASSNFGGYRHGQLSFSSDIVRDFKLLLNDSSLRNETAKIGKLTIETLFDKGKTNEKLFAIYEMIKKAK